MFQFWQTLNIHQGPSWKNLVCLHMFLNEKQLCSRKLSKDSVSFHLPHAPEIANLALCGYIQP